MKRFITSILMASAVAVSAGEPDSRTLPVLANAIGTTNSVSDGVQLSGFVHAIDFTMNGGTVNTGVCTVAITSGNLTIYNGVILASCVKQPRQLVHSVSGTALGNSNAFERVLLVRDKVTASVAEVAGVTNNVTIRLMLDK